MIRIFEKLNLSLKSFFLIILIVTCIFAVVRIVDLDNYAMHRDEIANGLDAYTLGINGTNIYGEKYPVFFKLHDTDLLEPTYKYMLVPFIYLFGRSEFSVRILAVLISFVSIYLISRVAKEIFQETLTVYLAAFFLSVSFVNFIFSRIGFRANFIPLFLTLILLFFYKTKKNENNFPFLMLSLGLMLLTYAVSRVMVPVLGLLVIYIVFNKNIRVGIINLIVGSLIFITLATPIYYLSFFDDDFSARTSKVAVFDEINALELFTKNFKSYYSWDYVFREGDFNPRYSVSGFGFENPVIIILSLIAIVIALRKNKEFLGVVLIVYVASMLPGYLTEPSHSLRTIGVAIPISLLAAYAGSYILRKNPKLFKIIFILVCLIHTVFLINYFFYNKEGHEEFYPGIKQATIFANKITKPENVVYGFGIYRPYVFQLFFAQSYTDTGKPYVDEFVSRQCNVGTNIVDCYYHDEFAKQGNIYIEESDRLNGLEKLEEVLFTSKNKYGEDLYAVIK